MDDNIVRFTKKVLSKLEPSFQNTIREELDTFKSNAFPIDTDLQRQMDSPSKGKRKIIFINRNSPGDIIMMTAAIRDLHKTYPNEYVTDVDSPCPEIFEGNPYISKLDSKDPDVIRLETHYPLIHNSNRGSYHFIHGYRKHFEERIGRPIKQGDMKGDIYIRDEEKAWINVVEEITKDKRPFWVIDAGHKQDFTAKAWPFECYQEVVDHFKDKIQFVQMGHQAHIHPELDGVINLVGQTDLRQLIRLIYWSSGVLTPVSMPMVLAQAVPCSFSFPKNRPCVVIAGGREPVQWQHYPNHQFLHTCGTMPCCDDGGCWKSRVVPLGDGDEKDRSNLCLYPMETLYKGAKQAISKCMASITTEDVIRAVERFYEGQVLKYHPSKTISLKYNARDRGKMNTYTEVKPSLSAELDTQTVKTDNIVKFDKPSVLEKARKKEPPKTSKVEDGLKEGV